MNYRISLLYFLLVVTSLGTMTAFAEHQPQAVDPADSPAFSISRGIVYAEDDEHFGNELWLEQPNGKHVLIKDIVQGPEGSNPDIILAWQDAVLFTAYSRNRGRELWYSDGTTQGTQLLADIYPGPNDSNPHHFVELDEGLYFLADTGEDPYSVWFTDGTHQGTYFIASDPESSMVAEFFQRSDEPINSAASEVYVDSVTVDHQPTVSYIYPEPDYYYIFSPLYVDYYVWRPFYRFGRNHVYHLHNHYYDYGTSYSTGYYYPYKHRRRHTVEERYFRPKYYKHKRGHGPARGKRPHRTRAPVYQVKRHHKPGNSHRPHRGHGDYKKHGKPPYTSDNHKSGGNRYKQRPGYHPTDKGGYKGDSTRNKEYRAKSHRSSRGDRSISQYKRNENHSRSGRKVYWRNSDHEKQYSGKSPRQPNKSYRQGRYRSTPPTAGGSYKQRRSNKSYRQEQYRSTPPTAGGSYKRRQSNKSYRQGRYRSTPPTTGRSYKRRQDNQSQKYYAQSDAKDRTPGTKRGHRGAKQSNKYSGKRKKYEEN